jgi:ABC-type lipoprotein release transport system permease subunit
MLLHDLRLAARTLGRTPVFTSIANGVSPTDALTLAAVALPLASVALLACYIRARRAAHIDPIVALPDSGTAP